VQLLADAHDTDVTLAVPPLLRLAMPGTSIAERQTLRTSVVTNACRWPDLSR
jgi:hypothetical protein